MHGTCSLHLILLGLVSLLIFGQEQKLCSFHHPHDASFLLDVLLNTLFTIVNICSVLSVQDVALHCNLTKASIQALAVTDMQI